MSWNNTSGSGFKKTAKSLLQEFGNGLIVYTRIRSRQLAVFSYIAGEVIFESFADLKKAITRKMFWGRSPMYRLWFHMLVLVATITALITGVTQRINSVQAAYNGLAINNSIVGRQDLFSQKGTAESIGVLGINAPDYPVHKHKVKPGETLGEIAEEYGVSANTVKWANNLTSDTVNTGQILTIPGLNGVIVTVKSGDTLDSIAKKYNGKKQDIIDLNSNIINPFNPTIASGDKLFVYKGELPVPTSPPVIASTGGSSFTVPPPPNGPTQASGFVHPLSACSGWTYSRGFSYAHDGVDLARSGGCWINSIGAGTVVKAGWGYAGEGYEVIIYHGNNLYSRYFHGSGNYAVQTGQQVSAGQSIMYMGCTGNCWGTHLHLEISIGDCYAGCTVNPESYVRLR